jgi:hypothetical protein
VDAGGDPRVGLPVAGVGRRVPVVVDARVTHETRTLRGVGRPGSANLDPARTYVRVGMNLVPAGESHGTGVVWTTANPPHKAESPVSKPT